MNQFASTIVVLVSGLSLCVYSQVSHAENSTEQPTANENTQHNFHSLEERFSYAYGVELAQRFKAEGVALNVDIMATAMHDVLTGDSVKMSADEVATTTQLFEELHYKKKEAERAARGEKNKQAGKAYLEKNADRENVIVTDSGLQYKIITQGQGEYSPTANDVVTVHYRGTFTDGTEFDNSRKHQEAFVAKVDGLIAGWIEALQLMTVGAKWQLVIPPDLAYGEEGSGDWIAPHATLIFEVELLSIQ